MKVKVLKGLRYKGVAQAAGAVIEVEPNVSAIWIKGGLAEPSDEKPKGSENPEKPEIIENPNTDELKQVEPEMPSDEKPKGSSKRK